MGPHGSGKGSGTVNGIFVRAGAPRGGISVAARLSDVHLFADKGLKREKTSGARDGLWWWRSELGPAAVYCRVLCVHNICCSLLSD